MKEMWFEQMFPTKGSCARGLVPAVALLRDGGIMGMLVSSGA